MIKALNESPKGASIKGARDLEMLVFSASSAIDPSLGLPPLSRKISIEERGGTWYVRYPHIDSDSIITVVDMKFIQRAIKVTHKQYRRKRNLQQKLKEELSLRKTNSDAKLSKMTVSQSKEVSKSTSFKESN